MVDRWSVCSRDIVGLSKYVWRVNVGVGFRIGIRIRIEFTRTKLISMQSVLHFRWTQERRVPICRFETHTLRAT